MTKIRDGKLLYHMTALENIQGVAEKGLLPRSSVPGFVDIADREIIKKRQSLKLEDYVPFHWFCNNPFDGAVLQGNPRTDFVLITVRRVLAQGRGWKIIPRHPLAAHPIELMEYIPGFNAISWDVMERRDYKDPNCKSVCMAECLSPTVVPLADFFKVYVQNENAESKVAKLMGGSLVDLKPYMFAARK